MRTNKKCRFCGTHLRDTMTDLGMSPLANSYVSEEELNEKEVFYPLHVYVCSKCFLVQLEEFESPDTIFNEYAYFSSYSDTWLNHARKYVEMVSEQYKITNEKQVVEIACNDGYLLQYFKAKGIPVMGVEPAANVAQTAIEKGIPTIIDYFGRRLAQNLCNDGLKADLLIGNNVLAHVPNINDFVGGMKILLHNRGVITMEFPHLLKLMQGRQFDTIYHEHFSYLSFGTVEDIFYHHGLRIFDVEELSTHGGSLRIYACHHEFREYPIKDGVIMMRKNEVEFGMKQMETYHGFAEQVKSLKFELLQNLIALKNKGKKIVGYGAPAKGNTLLNFCGIRTDFLDYTVDRSPHKQGKYLPGTHIPVFGPEKILDTKPDYVLILPWNLKEEIMEQMKYIREWGGQFIIAIPNIEVI